MVFITFQKRAVVFSIDAMFALLIAATIFSAIFFYLDQVSVTNYDAQHLSTIAMNSLTILEKDLTFQNTVKEGSLGDLQLFLNATEHFICANITLYDSENALLYTTMKDNCTHSSLSTTTKRSFREGHFEPYYATMEVWYDEG